MPKKSKRKSKRLIVHKQNVANTVNRKKKKNGTIILKRSKP